MFHFMSQFHCQNRRLKRESRPTWREIVSRSHLEGRQLITLIKHKYLVYLKDNELFRFQISEIQDQVEEVQPANRQSQKSAPPTPVEAPPKPLPVPPTRAESPPPAQNHHSDRTFEARRGFIEHGKFNILLIQSER